METIRGSGESLLALLNDILDFSKIEAGKLDIEAAPFALRHCVEEAVDLLAARRRARGWSSAAGSIAAVPARDRSDATRLRQILVNLLDNAVKFTAARRGLPWSADLGAPARAAAVELRFAVRDTGIGIAAERMDRLFQPFSQADSSTSRLYGGTGLGLAISRRLAEGLGGRIWVESEPEQGSDLLVHDPLPGRRHSAACPAREPRAARPERGLAGRSPLRILVAEDNVVNQKVALLLLERLGYRPTWPPTARRSWRRCAGSATTSSSWTSRCPDMDGLEATRRIRDEWPAEERPRIIAVTASALQETARPACPPGWTTS